MVAYAEVEKKECLRMILDNTSFTYTGLHDFTKRILEEIFANNKSKVTLEVTKKEKKTLNGELKFYPHLFLNAPEGQTDYHLVGPSGLLIKIEDNETQ